MTFLCQINCEINIVICPFVHFSHFFIRSNIFHTSYPSYFFLFQKKIYQDIKIMQITRCNVNGTATLYDKLEISTTS